MAGTGAYLHSHERGGGRSSNAFDRTWAKHEADIKVSCACDRCNSGWMSVLDNDVKRLTNPMVSGESTKLDSADLALFSSWAFKTTLVSDHLQAEPLFSFATTNGFYQNRSIPDTARIWLAHSRLPTEAAGHSWLGGLTVAVAIGEEPELGHGVDSNTFLFMGHINHLVFFVFDVVGRIPDDWSLDIEQRRGGFLQRVWPIPPSGEVGWPPIGTIPFDKVLRFGQTFI
jgi:hypothetical protein